MASIPVTIIGEMHYTGLSPGWPLPPPGAGGGQPPGIWPPVGVVSPPIYYPPEVWPPRPPSPPVGIWPPAGVVSPPIYYPPEIWPPRPPSAGQPPGIWPSPGYPAHPIVLPPGFIPGLKPEHPIYIPPPTPGVPTHPIVLPPEPEKPQVLENWEAKTYWTPQTGWAVAIVPSESHPGVPTPAKPKP